MSIEELRKLYGEGFSLIPLSAWNEGQGSERGKLPKDGMTWEQYQTERATWKAVDTWYKTFPNCNWAIICGRVSENLIVLDFDDLEVYYRIFPNHEGLEQETTVVKTSRGVHVYLHGKAESRDVFTTSGEKIVEIRCEGRYVVAPGSKHHTGVMYEYISNTRILEIHEDVLDVIITKAEDAGYQIKNKPQVDVESILKGVNDGDRDNSLIRLITFLRRIEKAENEALKMCYEWNKRNKPPLENTKIDEKVKYHYAREKPYGYYFKQNPAKCDINEKLVLVEKTASTESEFEIIPEVDSIDDIPLPTEDVIPPISFDGLPDYNLIKLYVNYVATVSDTYPEFSFLNGIAMLSTTIRRRLCFRLNGRFEYTNLWVLCLGQSGYARKGGAMWPAQNILREALGDTFLSKDVSPEGLISDMADVIEITKKTKSGYETERKEQQTGGIRKALCALWKDEAGQFYAQLNKSHMQSMKELLCHFYDCPNDYPKTLSSKKFYIDEIYLSMNLATTPTSFIENVTKKDVNTGFLARHNIVNPSYKKTRKPISEDSDDDMLREKAFEILIKTIDQLLPDKPLRMMVGKENLKILDEWCQEREEYFARERNETMGSFFARFQINVLKIAAILDLSNLPFYLYLYKKNGDNSYSEDLIFIKPDEIIRKNEFSLAQGDDYLNNIVSHINNNMISDYQISSMCISKSSLIYAMKLYDSVFLPYAYQICLSARVEVFTNYLTTIYKILQDKKKIDYSLLLRNSNVPGSDFAEAIMTLKEAGAVKEYKVKGKTKPQRVFVFVPSAYTKFDFKHVVTDMQDNEAHFTLTKRGLTKSPEPQKENVETECNDMKQVLLFETGLDEVARGIKDEMTKDSTANRAGINEWKIVGDAYKWHVTKERVITAINHLIEKKYINVLRTEENIRYICWVGS